MAVLLQSNRVDEVSQTIAVEKNMRVFVEFGWQAVEAQEMREW